jgi:phospholipase/carboxylesterase
LTNNTFLGDKILSLQFIDIPPQTGNSAIGLMVVLHGWGANANDLASLVPDVNLPEFQFLCLDAPFPHYSVQGGKAWYSLERSDYQGLAESRQMLGEWLKSLPQITSIPLSKTFLCGFSQGGAMTLDVGVTLPLAGLICLSGYLHAEPQPKPKPLPPTLIIHGRQDSVVPIRAAHQARNILSVLGSPVEYEEFDMGHEIPMSVLPVIRNFVMQVMAEVC